MKWLVILFLSFFSLVPLAPLEAQAPAGPEAEAALALAFGPKAALSPCPCGLGGPCTCAPLSCTCPACQQAKAPRGNFGDYLTALASAKETNKPLVVGVQCDPPQGSWYSCRVESFPGIKEPCVILSVPNRHLSTGMEWLHTFDCSCKAPEVADLLGRKTAAPRQLQPAFQPALQARGGACSG